MGFKARQKHFNDLMRVTTVSSVAEYWGVAKNTVVYHILRENIAAVKDGGIWIVSIQSVIDLWGMPTNMPSCDPPTAIDILQERYKAS